MAVGRRRVPDVHFVTAVGPRPVPDTDVNLENYLSYPTIIFINVLCTFFLISQYPGIFSDFLPI